MFTLHTNPTYESDMRSKTETAAATLLIGAALLIAGAVGAVIVKLQKKPRGRLRVVV